MDYLLTIAIPTYNRCKLLVRTLNSVLSQIEPKVEILISDNASEDDTKETIENLMVEYKQIRYIKNNENIGPDNNFLQCYKEARGKYVMLLGSDDILLEGSLSHMIQFLESNQDLTLIFLNHNHFKGDYIDINHCYDLYMKNQPDFTTSDKNTFICSAKGQMTFMSATIVNQKAVTSIDNPQKYSGTYFIHTCLMFEATKNNSKFGVIGYPCVAQDNTRPDQNGNSIQFTIFGRNLNKVYCHIAPQFGYDKKIMERIYFKYICSNWPKTIGIRKAKNIPFEKNFWNDGFPVIQKRPLAWLTIMPTILVPKCIFRIILRLYCNIKNLDYETV